VVVVSVLALREYLRMALPSGRGAEQFLALVAGAVLTVTLSLASVQAGSALLVVLFLLFGTLFLFRFKSLDTVVHQLALLVFGLMYIPLLLGHLSLLHAQEHGKGWIFFVMFLVMASDSLAYFSGMRFGRNKLYPAISPNKSVEGAFGGLAGGVVAALVVRAWLFPPLLGWFDAVLLGVGLGAASQVGDLFESMLKRSFGVKDSGTLIPGHGGMLDRLDSLLFAYPLAYYYVLYLL